MPNILIVDDHPMICFGMGAMAESIADGVTLFFANSFQKAIDQHCRQQMDLIILDLGLPGGLGVEMIRRFKAVQPDINILICTSRDELFNAPIYIQSGAKGFLHKYSTEAETKNAIKTVLEGKKYVSQAVHKLMVSNLVNNEPLPVDPIRALSPRERQVLALLLKGKWLKEIAQELNVAVPTVGTQKAKIFQKLNVTNMVELSRKMDAYYENDKLDLV
ncbi:Response regulator UvrY [Dyadobacter sp. CECT 9623]|uniref:Response regulator UvrY n=1 Tax=Dyadobacter linearis TaxID=2823330 RepID=A0ABM8UJ68_9BACT|nr:response regulator transcription factor [Dyadobacter sp. CECT 9623]CAG5067423.1 Response regulator UvrY [Dyadobacter sp. CECT 9623]